MATWMCAMSDPRYLDQEFRTANEPKVHPLVKGSFIFVPTTGMRLAPEVLVLELMREVFFDHHYGDGTTGAKDLDPDDVDPAGQRIYTEGDQAVIYALRGRRKKSKKAKTQDFFTPAYPWLARNAWLRKSSDRVVYNFLLSGPVAQYIWHSKRGREVGQGNFVGKIRGALAGNNSCYNSECSKKEILSAALVSTASDPGSLFNFIETAPATRNLLGKTGRNVSPFLDFEDDELAGRIAKDLEAICDLEPKIPRMQWLQLLMTFLRFSLPMWLLAQMRITCLVHRWIVDAVDKGVVLDQEDARQCLSIRNRGLLHPTLTPTREIFEHIDRYMKCRVELDILLYCLEAIRPAETKEKNKIKLEGSESDVLNIDELLILARDAAGDLHKMDRFGQVSKGEDISMQVFLAREGEQFSAWRRPRTSGQGKNIDEFFRVLYRAAQGDEAGGHLLSPEGEGAKRGFKIFPGQMLLKTIAYLAAQDKCSNHCQEERGMLVLQDVEDHFAEYGIDFSSAADARPLLMKSLQEMGLLKGSPDAGSSVAVECPY